MLTDENNDRFRQFVIFRSLLHLMGIQKGTVIPRTLGNSASAVTLNLRNESLVPRRCKYIKTHALAVPVDNVFLCEDLIHDNAVVALHRAKDQLYAGLEVIEADVEKQVVDISKLLYLRQYPAPLLVRKYPSLYIF